MNRGQEEQTCCVSRAGIMAWIIHLCNIIVSLAVCALTFGILGVLLYLYFDTNAKVPTFTAKIFQDAEHHPVILMCRDPKSVLYIIWVSLFITGLCAMVSATCSVILLAKPRLHYAFYLSTWMFTGKFLLDGALLYAFTFNETRDPNLLQAYGINPGLFTVAQLMLHTSVTVAMIKRDRGERSCCLPWNATGDGDIQCC